MKKPNHLLGKWSYKNLSTHFEFHQTLFNTDGEEISKIMYIHVQKNYGIFSTDVSYCTVAIQYARFNAGSFVYMGLTIYLNTTYASISYSCNNYEVAWNMKNSGLLWDGATPWYCVTILCWTMYARMNNLFVRNENIWAKYEQFRSIVVEWHPIKLSLYNVILLASTVITLM